MFIVAIKIVDLHQRMQTDADEHIGEKLWPVLKGIIMTAIENRQDLIIEGAYIFPEYLSSFSENYMEHILPVFICFTEQYIRSNFSTAIIKYRHAAETRGYEEDRPVEEFIRDHVSLMQKCEACKLKYFIINMNYEEEMEQVFSFISASLKSNC